MSQLLGLVTQMYGNEAVTNIIDSLCIFVLWSYFHYFWLDQHVV